MKILVIDFEYAFSAGWLHDIGKFFRRKDDNIQKYIDQNVYKCFAQAYNSKAKYHLPDHWLLLARLADIPENRPLGRRQEQDIIYLAKITEIFMHLTPPMAIEGLKNSSEKKGLSVAKTG